MTTVATSAVVSAIITCGNFITTRYLSRILDRIEKTKITSIVVENNNKVRSEVEGKEEV